MRLELGNTWSRNTLQKALSRALLRRGLFTGSSFVGYETKRPSVYIHIPERHVGQATIDPAAETELALFCTELGFKVIDPDAGEKSDADVLIVGEGFSEFATRHGNLVSVKSRLEVKGVERTTGRVLAIDRQTTVAVDLTEQIAGKSALQDAAARIGLRLLPTQPGGSEKLDDRR
jgi:hypothetical protein